MSDHEITTVAQLREVIGAEIPGIGDKNIDYLDEWAQAFIAKAPFLVLSTASAEGAMDTSPKGDAPGFVQVVDERTLLVPDRAGNKLAYGHRNVLENPNVGLIFMIPGTPETLRVNGRATLYADPELLAAHAAQGKPAKLIMRVAVDEVFFHCAKAFIRSGLWEAGQWPERHRVSFGEMFAARRDGDAELARGIDAAVEQDYRDNL